VNDATGAAFLWVGMAERLEDTTVYLHLSQRHLHAATNPLEQLMLRAGGEGKKR
jgi:hypothetical protein